MRNDMHVICAACEKWGEPYRSFQCPNCKVCTAFGLDQLFEQMRTFGLVVRAVQFPQGMTEADMLIEFRNNQSLEIRWVGRIDWKDDIWKWSPPKQVKAPSI